MNKQPEGKGANIVATLNRAPATRSEPIFNVDDLAANVRRITTTDDGKLQIVLEGEGLDAPTIGKVRDLLRLQSGMVLVSFRPAQQDLFN